MDLFRIAAQATGVLETTIKGTTSSFMKHSHQEQHTQLLREN